MTGEFNEEQQELFRLFEEHHKKFKTLYDAGVFKVKGGMIEIHVDKTGQVSRVRAIIDTYKSR